MAAGIPDHRDVKFPPEALEYRRRLVEQAPPLTPEQRAIIRAAFTPVRPAPMGAAHKRHPDE